MNSNRIEKKKKKKGKSDFVHDKLHFFSEDFR